MKICFYAINGHGLGHLSRCYAVAKKLKDLLEMLSLEADIQFLTTSDADYLVRDFPVFKIPSRASFKGRKAAANRYAANGKMMVSSMLSHFSPDLLVMDTVAQGSFQEFAFVKDFAKKRVLIDRHKKSDYRGARIHQAHLPLFDKILVPDDAKHGEDYSYEDEILNKVRFVGKIHNFERSEAWSRERVRDYFHVSEGQKLVYLSAGGGGDAEAEEQIAQLLEVVSGLNVKVILGYGALSQSTKIYGEDKIVSLTECGVSRYFKGVDLALSAAGYNTYEELMAAQVNSLFFIQTKGMDVQERRVIQGVEAGWHDVIDLNDSRADLLEKIKCSLAEGVSQGLLDREYPTGDSVAAYELLTTCLRNDSVDKKLKVIEVGQGRDGVEKFVTK
ncbi:MAG: UDP-N-acetylglucosamine--N-acetylmuramyl-(pentapeptide) pyrophosphoryl-undecaprenol N-acetylglucosamine transferase [Cryomorphaceae bacterium]|jgi:UDP-N-acetylglucosamine--N-acetylmuramyl-(pentapeptide) pyrophosphoryl-undecaprenol N-acetylglucosamine transferase